MKNRSLKITILSLSLLTVMAGAAVAPAMGSIKQNFANVNPNLINMILTLPGLIIMLTSLIFSYVSRKFNVKTISLFSLVLYSFGGALGVFATSIGFLLFTRVLLGIAVGLIMPLSTGLLAY